MQTSDALQNFCVRLAETASAAILPHFRNLADVENKAEAGYDPVTIADRDAEAAMRRLIMTEYPDDGIDGEEFGVERSDADHVWVLDPIDGTRSFITGVLSWGVLVGRTSGGRAQFGMMHQPFVGETFFGDGRAATHVMNGKVTPLRTRGCARLGDAVMLSTAPEIFSAEETPVFNALRREVRLTRFGTDCYGYCMLAAGQADIVVEAGLKSYDIAALIPIIEGAGGVVTSWTGGSALDSGRVAASGDPRLHEQLLRHLEMNDG